MLNMSTFDYSSRNNNTQSANLRKILSFEFLSIKRSKKEFPYYSQHMQVKLYTFYYLCEKLGCGI